MDQNAFQKPADFFVSWNHQDEALKNKVVDFLDRNGYSYWDSDRDCAGSLETCIDHVKACQAFLVILTDNALASEWVLKELRAALAKENGINRIVALAEDSLVLGSLPLLHPDLADEWRTLIMSTSVGFYGDGGANLKKEAKGTETTNLLTKCQSAYWNAQYDEYHQSLARERLAFLNLIQGSYDIDPQDWEKCSLPREVVSLNKEDKNTLYDEPTFFASRKNAIILGEAGSGKSQYLHRLTHLVSQAVEKGDLPLVLFLSCRDFAQDPKLSLLERLYQIYCPQNPAQFSSQLFHDFVASTTKKVSVYFDALDEIPSSSVLARFINEVADFAKIFPYVRLVFTSRNESDVSLLQGAGIFLKRYRLAPFSEEARMRLVSSFFVLINKEDECEPFFVSLKEIQDAILANPLFLTQLAIIYDQTGSLPKTRSAILEKITDILLRSRPEEKALQVQAMGLSEETLVTLTYDLHYLAYERFVEAGENRYRKNEEILSDILDGPDERANLILAHKIIDYLTRRGFLIEDNFAFQLLYEFYAASYVKDQTAKGFPDAFVEEEDTLMAKKRSKLDQLLLVHYHDPRWSNVFSLYVCLMDSLTDLEVENGLASYVAQHTDGDMSLLFASFALLDKDPQDVWSPFKYLLAELINRVLRNEESPYGQLCYFVPRYGLYYSLLCAGAFVLRHDWGGDKAYKVASILRDVIFAFGTQGLKAENYVPKDNWVIAFFKDRFDYLPCTLRGDLDRAFFGLEPVRDYHLDPANESHPEGSEIWPFLFDDTFTLRNGQAIETGRQLFVDDLGYFHYPTRPDKTGEFVGLVFLPADKETLEHLLNSPQASRVSGLVLGGQSKTPTFPFLNINRGQFQLVVSAPRTSAQNFEADCLSGYGLDTSEWKMVFAAYMSGSIDKRAGLAGNPKLKQVFLPWGVNDIGPGTFADCPKLESVCGLSEDNFNRIGKGAFAGDVSLDCASLLIDDEEIEPQAFAGCKALQELTLKEGKVAEEAFRDCPSLKSVHLGQRVSSIKPKAFADCPNLSSFSVDPANETYASDGLALIDKKSKTLLCYAPGSAAQEYTVPSDVEIIAEGAFADSQNLKKVVLGDSLKTIGKNAFARCEKLVAIVLPASLSTLGEDAFVSCPNLVSFVLDPANPAFSSDSRALYDAKKTTLLAYAALSGPTYQIPEGVTAIADFAFAWVAMLTSVQLPKSLKKIGSCAFSDCTNLSEIVFPPALESVGFGAFSHTSIRQVVFPDSLRELGSRVFSEDSALQEVSLPSGLSLIRHLGGLIAGLESSPNGESATLEELSEPALFPSSAKIVIREKEPEPTEGVGVGETLRTYSAFSKADLARYETLGKPYRIAIKEDLTSIKAYQFADLHYLVGVDFPSSLKNIDFFAFQNCTGLTSLVLPEGVVSVNKDAFQGCHSLEEIRLPSSLTSASGAFNDLPKLSRFIVAAENPELYSDGRALFSRHYYHSDQLTLLSYVPTSGEDYLIPEGVKIIGPEAFLGAQKLKHVVLPASLATIYEAAFYGCSSLEEIALPPALDWIHLEVFTACTQLKKISVDPANPAYYAEDDALYSRGNNGLVFVLRHHQKEVVVKEGTTEIGSSALAGMAELESVVFPSSLKEIDERAFAHCPQLKQLNLPEGLQKLGRCDFASCPSLKELTIPSSLDLRRSLYLLCSVSSINITFLPPRKIFDLEVISGVPHSLILPATLQKIIPWSFSAHPSSFAPLEFVVVPLGLKAQAIDIFGAPLKVEIDPNSPGLCTLRYKIQ